VTRRARTSISRCLPLPQSGKSLDKYAWQAAVERWNDHINNFLDIISGEPQKLVSQERRTEYLSAFVRRSGATSDVVHEVIEWFGDLQRCVPQSTQSCFIVAHILHTQTTALHSHVKPVLASQSAAGVCGIDFWLSVRFGPPPKKCRIGSVLDKKTTIRFGTSDSLTNDW